MFGPAADAEKAAFRDIPDGSRRIEPRNGS